MHPTFPILSILVATTLLSAGGCAAQSESRSATPRDILDSMPTGAEKQRWQTALDAGKTPPVSAIPIPSNPVSTRSAPPPRAMETPPKPTTLALTPGGDIPLELPEGVFYSGPGQIQAPDADTMRIQLKRGGAKAATPFAFTPNGSPTDTFDLHVAPPSKRSAKLPTGNLLVHLDTRESAPAMAREAVIGNASGQILHFQIQRGTPNPFDRKYLNGALRIRQLVNKKDQPTSRDLPVRIEMGQRSVDLKAGQVHLGQDAQGPYEIKLLHSHAYSEAEQQVDSPAFAVHITFTRLNK